MLIDKNTHSVLTMDGKNENWIGDSHWFVDDNSELAEKINASAPWFEPVVEDGELVDITPLPAPPKPLTEIQKLQIALAELAEIMVGGDI